MKRSVRGYEDMTHAGSVSQSIFYCVHLDNHHGLLQKF